MKARLPKGYGGGAGNVNDMVRKAQKMQEEMQQAQEELIAQASSDTVMLEQARQRAQTLLEEYIRGIAAACNQTFTVEWVYLNESGEEISRSTTTLSGVQ